MFAAWCSPETVAVTRRRIAERSILWVVWGGPLSPVLSAHKLWPCFDNRAAIPSIRCMRPSDRRNLQRTRRASVASSRVAPDLRRSVHTVCGRGPRAQRSMVSATASIRSLESILCARLGAYMGMPPVRGRASCVNCSLTGQALVLRKKVVHRSVRRQ